ncbi:hypothetical protein BT93_F1748 [Corymbia citriodora subsp. variegata]|nr:hypothetical protein BT93_F1748 [Corymbia citriodora subsp. variegata]
MPPFLSTCKSVGLIVARTNCKRHVIKPASSYRQLQNCHQTRCLGCIAGVKAPSIHRRSDANKDLRILRGSLHSGDAVQTRRFLGCGDGEEGGALSKVYEERRVLGYSPVQLFDVAAAVDLYQDFVPWCQRSEILKSCPDGSFDAELEIGFKFLVESYVSHVELKRPQYIKVNRLPDFLGRITFPHVAASINMLGQLTS